MASYELESKEGMFVVISGPSGVGKDSVINELMKRDATFKHSVSLTTRQPRGAEQNGKDYFFVSREKFHRMIEQGGVLEFDEYLGELYGTPLEPLRIMKAEKDKVLLDLTVEGGINLKKHDNDTVLIFLLPPSDEALRRRLQKRSTESQEKIEQRIKQMQEEVIYAEKYDYLLINDNLEATVAAVESIVAAKSAERAHLLLQVREN